MSLHDAWAQYRYLFNESNERVQLLNTCASWFFATTQRLLMREVILGISRLTDPVKFGRFDNLVLSSLLFDPALRRRAALRDEIEQAIGAVTADAEHIRVHRNKYIAHLDHATAMGLNGEFIVGLRSADVTSVITRIEAIYNLHNSRVHRAHASFDLSTLGSAKAVPE